MNPDEYKNLWRIFKDAVGINHAIFKPFWIAFAIGVSLTWYVIGLVCLGNEPETMRDAARIGLIITATLLVGPVLGIINQIVMRKRHVHD